MYTEAAKDSKVFLPLVLSGSSGPEGVLEIHVFNVGQGDSQLIIGPTRKTLLIDESEPSWNTHLGATWVASEIQRITGGTHLDYVMVTHWHLDHIGYAGEGGIWSLLEEQGITADVLIDRDGGVWNDVNSDSACDPATEIEWHNAVTTSGTAEKWALMWRVPTLTARWIWQAMCGTGSATGIATRITAPHPTLQQPDRTRKRHIQGAAGPVDNAG